MTSLIVQPGTTYTEFSIEHPDGIERVAVLCATCRGSGRYTGAFFADWRNRGYDDDEWPACEDCEGFGTIGEDIQE